MPIPQDRRQFFHTFAAIASTAAIASGEPARAASSAPLVRWPNLTGSPVLDFILTADCVDTAFTDFSTHVKFQVDYAGRHWSDSDALFACMKRAMDNDIPILDGKFLAQVTRSELERIFAGNIEMPMLDDKMQVWHQLGVVLSEK